jgi:hypothetical protein
MKNSFGFEGIYIFQELDSFTPLRIKECEFLKNRFDTDIGISGQEKNFQEALWVCNSQFRNYLSGKSYTQRIFVFTVNDFPNEDDESLRAKTNDYLKVA